DPAEGRRRARSVPDALRLRRRRRRDAAPPPHVGKPGRSRRVREHGGRRSDRGDPESDEEHAGRLCGDRDGRPRRGEGRDPPRYRIADPRLLVLLGGADGRRSAGRHPMSSERENRRRAYDPGEDDDDEEERKEQDDEEEEENEDEDEEEEWNVQPSAT